MQIDRSHKSCFQEGFTGSSMIDIASTSVQNGFSTLAVQYILLYNIHKRLDVPAGILALI